MTLSQRSLSYSKTDVLDCYLLSAGLLDSLKRASFVYLQDLFYAVEKNLLEIDRGMTVC